MALDRVAVVGASLAGLRAAETLRSGGFAGEVVVVGAEPHRPYDRPPLSKKLLAGEWDPERIQLRQPDSFDELDVDWRLGLGAAGLELGRDGGTHTVHLTDGDDLDVDACIIATGAACRRLPEQGRFAHVHELRTVDDAMGLRSELLEGGRRMVVIGAGFIGLEAAATAHALGNDVTVLEGAEAPLSRAIGAEMGAAIGALHEAGGIDVRCSVSVERLHDDGVVLAGDELVAADVVLVGIGVVPATAWLGDSGLELRDGVVCDETLLARHADGSAAERVYAAGDVLRWTNPLYGAEMRVEHWTNAAEQGAHAASNLLAVAAGEAAEPYAPVPFFWSDQGSQRIQFLGRSSPDDAVTVAAGSVDDGKWLALFHRDGTLEGALGVNAPRWVMPMRSFLGDRAPVEAALDHAAATFS